MEEASPEIDARVLGEATLVVIGGNVRAALEARAAALGRELGPADVERITWMRAADGRATTAADYARSIGVMHGAGRVVARFFTGYDVLLSPTMCRPPHPLGVIDMMTDDVRAVHEGSTRHHFSILLATARWPSRGREPPPRAPRHPPAPRRAGAIRTARSAWRCPPSS